MSIAASSCRSSGPSGCGKTTLLRAISGLDIQNTGTIEQDGRDISRLPVGAARFRHRLPVLRALSQSQRAGQCRLRPRQRGPAAGRDRPARDRVAGACRPARASRQISHPAFGRPAAAGRAGAGARPLAGAAAARRATLGARCAGARQAPRRNPRSAGPARHHHHHGDARPGGGADHVGPDRRDDKPAGSSRSGTPGRDLWPAGHAVRRRLRRAR